MALTNAYSTIPRFRTMAGIPDSEDDSKIELALNAASRQIDRHCGRRFYTDDSATARTYLATDSYCLTVDDFSSLTGLVVKIDADYNGTYETTLTIGTHFNVEPTGAATMSPPAPYNALRVNTSGDYYAFPASVYGAPTVQVTAAWGWPETPPEVEEACLLQARQLFKAHSATFGAFSLGDNGVSMRVRKMDQVAEGLLEAYRRVEC